MKKRGEFDMRFAKILSLVVFSLVIYQLIGVYNIAAYQTSWFDENNTNPSNLGDNKILVSEIENGNCYFRVNSYLQPNGTTYSITNTFYFPNTTILGTATQTKSGSQNCFFGGAYNSTSNVITNTILTPYLVVSDSATNRIATVRNDLVCLADSITLNTNGSFFANGFYLYNNSVASLIQGMNWIRDSYGICKFDSTIPIIPIPRNITISASKGWILFYPFNSGNGQIAINISDLAVDCDTNNIWVVGLSGQNTSYITLGSNVASINYTGTLTENTDYNLIKYCSRGLGAGYQFHPNVTIKIGTYEPIWDCGEYGNCINGTKQRTCIEHNGKLPNKLEFEVCYSAPDKTLWLGMENVTSENVFYTEQGWACIPTIFDKYVEYPTDWYPNPATNPQITNNFTGVNRLGFTYDNMMMSRETAKEGIYSLKLWNIPPEHYIPYCPNNNTGSWLNITGFYGLCVNGSTTELYPDGNYTISLTPQVRKLINETYLVAHDLTFGYPNMTVSLSVRKCDSVIKQYLNNSACQIVMGEGYYTIDKTSNHQIYNTKVYISIYDLNLSSTVYTVYFDANNEKLWNTYNIILTHLDTTHLYRFSIGIYDDIVSGKNYCAYIDNINLNAYSGAVGCESRCGTGDDSRTYYKFISQNEKGCSFLETPMSPNCFEPSLTQYLTGCSSAFCPVCESGEPDYLTLYSGDNSTGECLWTTVENSDYCANYCSTQKLISDNPLAQDIAVYFQFFNPIWIITFIIMGIGAFLAYKIKDWHIFAIAVIVGFFISAVVWIEMAFIAICIMIVVAYFMFKDMSSK